VEGRERDGPKLLLNQGPSEPCYATDDNYRNWTSTFIGQTVADI